MDFDAAGALADVGVSRAGEFPLCGIETAMCALPMDSTLAAGRPGAGPSRSAARSKKKCDGG
jgi:hypothetical protein